MRCEEAQELITALADSELAAGERGAVESHLAVCRACQAAHAIELDLKKHTRAAADAVKAPGDLRPKLSTLIDYASRHTPTQRPAPAHRRRKRLWRFALASVALALVLALFALPVYYVREEPNNLIAPAVFDTHRKVLAGEMDFVEAKNNEELERQLARAVDGKFKPMGYDLAMLKVKPARGAVHAIGERKILVVVYRGDGPDLTCFTFLGGEEDAPREAKLFFDPEKKMNFHTFSQDGINAVLHHENGVICILVSKLPMDELLTAARAKARHA